MINFIRSNKNLQEFIKFCIVGVANTAVNYFFYMLFLFAWSAHYLIAGVIGYLAGAVFGFIVNRKWTFKSTIANTYLFVYLAINVFSLLINGLIQWVVVEKLHVAIILSQACGIVVTTFINYFLTRKLVFQR